MKKSLALLALVGSTAVAQASFDLMLLPDTTTGGIVRYDPINRVRLGVFAQSLDSGWHSVNLRSTGGQVYLTGNHTMLYDYSTGVPIGSIDYPSGITTSNIAGTSFTEVSSILIYPYNANMVNVTAFSLFPIFPISAIPLSNNRIGVLGTNSAGDLVFVLRNNVTLATTTTLIQSSATYNADSASALTVTSDDGSQATVRLMNRSGGQNRLLSIVMNLNTLTATSSLQAQLSGFAPTSKLSIMRGHDGVYVVGNDSVNPNLTRISGINSAGFSFTNYTTSDVTVPSTRWVGANIVAPEPGSMAVLGLGLLGLMKRRKKS